MNTRSQGVPSRFSCESSSSSDSSEVHQRNLNTSGGRSIQFLRQKDSRAVIEAGLPEVYSRLWRYCLALCGNRDVANDLAQAATLRALEKSSQFQPGTHLDRWMFRIAQRIWLNDLRAQTIRRGGGIVPIEDVDLVDEKPGAEMNNFAHQVLKEVMALPEAQRGAVVLVYVEGFSYREAAEIMEIPVGTVMSRLAAARKKITSRFSEERTGTK